MLDKHKQKIVFELDFSVFVSENIQELNLKFIARIIKYSTHIFHIYISVYTFEKNTIGLQFKLFSRISISYSK